MNPRADRITDLRKEILHALDRYLFASRPQLYRIIEKRGEGKQETWERAVRRALDLLERAGYITHGAVYEDNRASRQQVIRRWVHYLTKKGAAAIAGGKPPHHERKPASLLHEEAVTEFHLELEQALKAHPSLKFHWLQRDIRKGTNPDAIFGIEDTTKPIDRSTHWFFLEIERCRAGNWKNGHDQKVRKLQRYTEYRTSGRLTRDWSFIGDFRVIFREETNERMMNLLRKLAPLLPYRFIWITSKELVREKGILERVFATPRDFRDSATLFLDLLQLVIGP